MRKVAANLTVPAWKSHSKVHPAWTVTARRSSSLGPAHVIWQVGMVSQSSAMSSFFFVRRMYVVFVGQTKVVARAGREGSRENGMV